MTQSQKSLVVEIIVPLIIVVALVGGLIFFRVTIAKTVDQLVRSRGELTERAAALESLSVLKSQYDHTAKAYLNVLYNIVPSKDQLIDLSREFRVLAEEQGIDFGFSFLGETPAGPEGLGAVNLTLNLRSASLDKLFKFVQKLQSFRYLIKLDSFTLNRQGEALELSVKGSVFFR